MQTLLCWLCFSFYLFRQYKIVVWSWTWCDKTWIDSQSVRRSIEVGYLSKRKLKVIVTRNKWGNLLSLSQLDLSSGSFFLSFQAGQMKGICTVRDKPSTERYLPLSLSQLIWDKTITVIAYPPYVWEGLRSSGVSYLKIDILTSEARKAKHSFWGSLCTIFI